MKEYNWVAFYNFVGAKAPVWIPDDILVVIDIVPTTRTNVRSRQPFNGQTKDSYHDTGNSGSTADSERDWLHHIMSSSQYAGFNFAADGVTRTIGNKTYRGKIIQLTPLNEVTWAAGTPDGNKYSWHVEQCFGGTNNWENSLYVNASLHGGLLAMMGWTVPNNLVQHNYWYGKDCPGQVRRLGIWSNVKDRIDAARVRALSAGTGITPTPSTPDTIYAASSPILVNGEEWDGSADIEVNGVKFYADPKDITIAVDSLARRQYAGTTSDLTGAYLKKGEKARVLGWVRGEAVDGEDRWWVGSSFSRVWVGGTTEKPTETPVEEPKPDTDGLFKIVNGRFYYRVNDGKGQEIIITRNCDLKKFAAVGSATVGTAKKGDKFFCDFWCTGDEVDGEIVWWIIKDKDDDDPNTGARVHASHVNDRPE